MASSCSGGGLVAVHVGAGYHSVDKTTEYKNICANACRVAIDKMKSGFSAVESAAFAVAVLEDAPITNAGYGSNLNIQGFVENDASIMDGTTLRFGSVGAVSNIQNPIKIAKCLLDQQEKGLLTGGRIPPSFLVGYGAKNWALTNNIPIIEDEHMITKEARAAYKKYFSKLNNCETPAKRRRLENTGKTPENASSYKPSPCLTTEVHDTVGALCIDLNGLCAAASSSGGLLLKYPGRIGPAAILGCGCWAQSSKDNKKSVATTASGCGESLIRTFFAKECANLIYNADCPSMAIHENMTRILVESDMFTSQSERLAGCLGAVYDPNEKHGELLWAHTTDSMCIGYASTSDDCVTTRMSRLKSGTMPGSSVLVEASPFHFKES